MEAQTGIEWDLRQRVVARLKSMTDDQLLLERRLVVAQLENVLKRVQDRTHHLSRIDGLLAKRGLWWKCYHCDYEAVGGQHHAHPCPADDVAVS